MIRIIIIAGLTIISVLSLGGLTKVLNLINGDCTCCKKTSFANTDGKPQVHCSQYKRNLTDIKWNKCDEWEIDADRTNARLKRKVK